jgi:alpha-ribazole phosphatase
MDFGSWEGRPWDAIDRLEFDRWTADFAHYRCGGGESVAQLLVRTSAALDEARGRGADALWITHGGVVRAVRLLVGGGGLPQRAEAWPREGLAFGESCCLELA